MLNLDCDPVPNVGLRYVGLMSMFIPSYTVSASLNTGTREIISAIQPRTRRAGVLRLTANAPALALKENDLSKSRTLAAYPTPQPS